jgi:hypothetical protein
MRHTSSTVVRRTLGAALLATVAALAAFETGCGGAGASGGAEVGASEADLGEALALRFDGAFQQHASGAFVKGKQLRVVYDAARLPTCRGEQGGVPQWSITGSWRIGNGPVRTFPVAGLFASAGSEGALLDLDASGELQLWFSATSRWGCNAYDSDFGKNYRFHVAPAASEPGWLGNAQFAIDRQTCAGGVCDGSLRPVTGDILYDAWARQRAAIRVLVFEAWKEGVTDFDNADLWKQLDVQVHARVEGTTAFTTRYARFDRRVGHNARYALDLTALDPIPGYAAVQDRKDCPVSPMRVAPGTNGAMVEVTLEAYVTVNGAELRPAGEGATDSFYRVRYQSPVDRFAVCVAH